MNRKAIFTDLAPAQVCHTSGENKIEGEGWVWFGDDDVFGDNAYSVIWQNKYLLSDYHEKNKTYNKSIIRNDSKLVGFNVEASFKGQNALTFMKKMGYEFKPKVYRVHEIIKTVYYPDAILITQKYKLLNERHVVSMQYVPRAFSLKESLVINYQPPHYGKLSKYTWFDPSFSFTDETWKEYQDVYSERLYLDKYINKVLEYMQEAGIPYKDILKEFWEQKLLK